MSFGAAAGQAAARHRNSFMKALRFVLMVASVVTFVKPLSAATSPPGAASCSGCHAVHQAASPAIPGIYGRNPDDVVAAMTAFRDGSVPATVMNRIAKGFSDDEVRAIAAWLATQK
jgi:cytochrome subunit of sulfide dehydrogenase